MKKFIVVYNIQEGTFLSSQGSEFFDNIKEAMAVFDDLKEMLCAIDGCNVGFVYLIRTDTDVVLMSVSNYN